MAVSSLTVNRSSLKQRLFSGGAWALCGRLVTAITGLVANALLARLLAPEEIGAYFLTLSLVSVASVIAQMGLDRTAVRLIAESRGLGNPGRSRAALRTVFRFGMLGAVAMAAVLAMGAGELLVTHVFDSPLMAGVISLAAVWVLVVTCQNLLAESFRGFHDIRRATIFGSLLTSMLSVLLFALLRAIQGRSNLSQILTLSILAGGVNVLIAGFLMRQTVVYLDGDERMRDREVLAIAWPMMMISLVDFVLNQADIWILGALRPHEEVAIYGAAARLVALVAAPLLIVNAVIPPIIAEAYAQGKKTELEWVLRTVATLTWIPSLLTLVVFAVLGASILSWVFGEYYSEGATVLTLLSLGQFINVGAGSCGTTLMMTGHQGTMMKIAIACGLLTIGGAMWLVGEYGATGVASAVSIAMAVQNILMLLFAKKKTGVWTHAWLSPPATQRVFSRN
jgi:O-antigen/teichoic acid export membrane protein